MTNLIIMLTAALIVLFSAAFAALTGGDNDRSRWLTRPPRRYPHAVRQPGAHRAARKGHQP